MSANGNNFTATIPAQSEGNIVGYYISLTDNYEKSLQRFNTAADFILSAK